MAVAHVDLWQRFRAERDPDAWDLLVRAYLRLVPYVAGRLAMGLPPGVDVGEMESHGVLGLLDALERFDPDRGVRFESYAIPWIRGAILAGLKAQHWSPQLMRRVRELEGVAADLATRLGRQATATELAAELGISLRDLTVRQREAGCMAVLSLDEAFARGDDGEDTPLYARLPDHAAPDPEEEVLGDERRRILSDAIAQLSANERRVVELYYYEGLTLSEISQVLGLSAARISQLHSKAVFRLRGRLGRLKAVLV